MWDNEHFADLPFGARLLQIGMINHADDQGRIKANPAWLRAQVFAYDDVSATQVYEWLHQIERNGTITLYEADGKQYAQLVKWWDYQSLQYASPSDYPPPHGWTDRIRKTVTKGFVATFNWTLTNGERVPDTCDAQGKPLSSERQAVRSLIESAGDSPEHSPEHSGDESAGDSPEDTNYRFNYQLPTKDQGSADAGSHDALLARLQSEWVNVNTTQVDGHWALVEHYGFEAWLRGFNACRAGARSNFSYVEKVISGQLDKSPPPHVNGRPPPPKERRFITDPVTKERREIES